MVPALRDVAEGAPKAGSSGEAPIARRIAGRVQVEIARRVSAIEALVDLEADPIAIVRRARTATRRMRTLLEFFAEGDSEARAIRRALRRIARSLGGLRELDAQLALFGDMLASCDVAVERAALEHVLADLRRRRSRALREVHTRPAMRDLNATAAAMRRTGERVVERLIRDDDSPAMARRRLRGYVDAQWMAPAPDGDELERLHTLRLRAKRIRHACGLVGPALEGKTLQRAAHEVQRALGRHRDVAMSMARLERSRAKHYRKGLVALGDGLAVHVDELGRRLVHHRIDADQALEALDRAIWSRSAAAS